LILSQTEDRTVEKIFKQREENVQPPMWDVELDLHCNISKPSLRVEEDIPSNTL
jgi:hypothetical protein